MKIATSKEAASLAEEFDAAKGAAAERISGAGPAPFRAFDCAANVVCQGLGI
jgi:hypothetical protein